MRHSVVNPGLDEKIKTFIRVKKFEKIQSIIDLFFFFARHFLFFILRKSLHVVVCMTIAAASVTIIVYIMYE